MNRLAERVSRLEGLQEQQARERGQPFWWELPENQCHLGSVGLNHEETIALLGAEGEGEGRADVP